MLDNFNNFDCLNLISQKLSCIDILSLKYSCKHLSSLKLILPNFKDLFINKLLQCNVVPTMEDALKFCDNLYDTGAYVAGSFILDCLYDTNYHNDIDIYDQIVVKDKNDGFGFFDCFNNDNTNLKFTQSLYKSNFKSVGNISETDLKLRSFINISNPECIDVRDDQYRLVPSMQSKRCKNNIQIIPIDLKLKDNERSVIPRFIRSSFDLDICQNLFDGKNLCVKNLSKLMYKYDFIKPNTKFMLRIYDIGDKNENERVKIYDDEYYEEESTKNRVNKYLKRGFDIKYHPKYDEIKLHIQKVLENNKYCKIHNCLNFGNCTNKDHPRDNIRCLENESINLSIYNDFL